MVKRTCGEKEETGIGIAIRVKIFDTILLGKLKKKELGIKF